MNASIGTTATIGKIDYVVAVAPGDALLFRAAPEAPAVPATASEVFECVTGYPPIVSMWIDSERAAGRGWDALRVRVQHFSQGLWPRYEVPAEAMPKPEAKPEAEAQGAYMPSIEVRLDPTPKQAAVLSVYRERFRWLTHASYSVAIRDGERKARLYLSVDNLDPGIVLPAPSGRSMASGIPMRADPHDRARRDGTVIVGVDIRPGLYGDWYAYFRARPPSATFAREGDCDCD